MCSYSAINEIEYDALNFSARGDFNLCWALSNSYGFIAS